MLVVVSLHELEIKDSILYFTINQNKLFHTIDNLYIFVNRNGF